MKSEEGEDTESFWSRVLWNFRDFNYSISWEVGKLQLQSTAR